MATQIVWTLALAAVLSGSCDGGLLRVPKVYNAVISSSDNLSPSRAFPLIQPVLHETALGYPLHPPFVYHQAPLPYPHPELPPPNILPGPPQENPDPKQEMKVPPEQGNQKPVAPPVPQDQEKKDKPPAEPSKENPLKLNEQGLPPSLVPIQQYPQGVQYQYDPYNVYNPYLSDPYSRVVLPYNSPYNPYYQPAFTQNPYNPYFNPYYNFPPPQQIDQLPQGPPQWPQLDNPQWPPQDPSQGPLPEGPSLQGPPDQNPQPEPSSPLQDPSKPPGQPSDLNIKNISNKNADIPDVPPPPLPSGGLKTDKKPPS